MGRLAGGLALVFLLTALSPARAQKMNPVQWSLAAGSAAAPPGSEVVLQLAAKMEPGWHVYSLSTPPGGPIPTTIRLAPSPAVEGYRLYQPKPRRAFDKNFNLDVETYDEQGIFLLVTRLSQDAPKGRLELTAEVRYQSCNDKMCLPPVRRTATASFLIDPAAKAVPASIPGTSTEFRGAAPNTAPAPAETGPAGPPRRSQGFAAFLLIAFSFGLAAVFTPCVFPMIPITVSFFLSRQTGGRRESVVQAAVFSLGIIVLFSVLGLGATAIMGPFGVVQLGSNPWVNAFIAVVFFGFALSLLGAFELTLPSGLLTRLDRFSRRGGTLGTLVMGLTFSLTSFACVGPLVGTLLAASVQGAGLQPLLGMVSFAAGLAAPFFLLALFPSYLQRLPRSGGWMSRIKVVLAFVILAAMLKYASNVDQVMQWNFLSRERFLAAWVVLFALPGLYLLGFLRLEGIQPDEPVGIWRLGMGSLFLMFAVSLLPGMFGARLGELDAYVPAASQPANAPAGGERLVWMKNQYREALALARQENKLVLVNFTGYACTNCHWMKANMFPRPEVQDALKDFVLVELYTDGSDENSQANQQLQESKFSTIAIPFYAILDGDERILATFPGLTRNPAEFVAFLKPASRS